MAKQARPPVWGMVKEAVSALGGNTINGDVRRWIQDKYPGTNPKTIACQIIICTVNHESRIHFPENKKARKAESRYDFLFRPTPGSGRLEWYDKSKHGLWEIAALPGDRFAPRKISGQTTKVERKRWTRDELLIALNLYHKLNFGQFTSRNPVIIAVAGKLGRKPGGLSMKLCNLASFDPALKMRGIMGLSGASELDNEMWNEFHANLDQTAPASEESFRALFGADETKEVEVRPKKGVRVFSAPTGPTETIRTVKVRCGQEYFRQTVLNNFGEQCGVTGLAIRELLIASHILPWGKHEAERLKVSNGIALSRLHDAAFDIGLITFDADLRLRLSRALKSHLSQKTVVECFVAYEGEQLRLPEEAISPDEKFLAIHRAKSLERWA